jgi:hypothetical protein
VHQTYRGITEVRAVDIRPKCSYSDASVSEISHRVVITFDKNSYMWLGNLMVLCAVHSNVYQQRDLGTRRDAAFLKSLKPEVSTEVYVKWESRVRRQRLF